MQELHQQQRKIETRMTSLESRYHEIDLELDVLHREQEDLVTELNELKNLYELIQQSLDGNDGDFSIWAALQRHHLEIGRQICD